MIGRLCIALGMLLEAVSVSYACTPPRYRKGRTWEDNATGITMSLSFRLDDFAPERLTCLTSVLREKYPDRNMMVLMFSSHEASLGYLVGGIDLPPKAAEYQLKLHGLYIYNKEEHENYLTIAPEGSREPARFTTRIDLPLAGLPACKLAINSRCLLEFQHIDYPSIDGKANVSGKVTLNGIIRRQGSLSHVVVANAEAEVPERQLWLAKWAKENLSTWRFERGKGRDAIHITYYFEAKTGGAGVQFRLPHEVRIETN